MPPHTCQSCNCTHIDLTNALCQLCNIHSELSLDAIMTNKQYNYLNGIIIINSTYSQKEIISKIANFITTHHRFPEINEIDTLASIVKMSIVEYLYWKTPEPTYKLFFTSSLNNNIIKGYSTTVSTNEFILSDMSEEANLPEITVSIDNKATNIHKHMQFTKELCHIYCNVGCDQ